MRYNEAMVSKHLQDRLSLLIIRSSMKGKYALVEVAEQNKLTHMQGLTLCLLEPHQPMPMKALSVFMSCDPSNITPIVEQLVVAGLVERKESPLDRRVKTVTLTAKGLALRDKFLQCTIATRLPRLDQLTQAEAERLIAMLETVTDTAAPLSSAV